MKVIDPKKVKGKGFLGPDLITYKVLKYLPGPYFLLLADLFNASLRFSHIPSYWKLAHVSMILKPLKNPMLSLSYRPISLLNTLIKLLERVFHSRLLSWCDSNSIISKIITFKLSGLKEIISRNFPSFFGN